jgi:hypothetical protein
MLTLAGVLRWEKVANLVAMLSPAGARLGRRWTVSRLRSEGWRKLWGDALQAVQVIGW